jgi:hypothetical protein
MIQNQINSLKEEFGIEYHYLEGKSENSDE